MNRYQMAFAPCSWSPKLNPLLVRLLGAGRWLMQRREAQLQRVEVAGDQHIRPLMADRCGVLVTPNHASHADPYAVYAAADHLQTPVYIMAAWHVFAKRSRWLRRVLQWHGVFSIDREAADLHAFRQGVEILQHRPHPLVVFPEGEIYHCNDRLTPFREGAAAMALSAAKKAERPVACVPCGIRYRYLDDPTPQLLRLMDELEARILWRPRRDQPLPERIYHFGHAVMSLKEWEYFGTGKEGTLPERIAGLCEGVLQKLEERHAVKAADRSPPIRVKALRRCLLEKLRQEGLTPAEADRLQQDLDDVFLVVQLFSYPGDYVAQSPSIERIAETLDKFEEDVLQRSTASIKGRRLAQVRFGEAIAVRRGEMNSERLTCLLEERVTDLLQSTSAGKDRTTVANQMQVA